MKPFAVTLSSTQTTFTPGHNHTQRRLSSMRGQYNDVQAFERLLASDDQLVYEVFECKVPAEPGHLIFGTSLVHPGRVGDEYFMTKGHFHKVLETAEVYSCLKGQGVMLMETPEGEWQTETLEPGRVLYVPPRWAHRTINIGDEDLVLFFTYPAHAGHDYQTIETKGFRKMLVARDGQPTLDDNPRWKNEG